MYSNSVPREGKDISFHPHTIHIGIRVFALLVPQHIHHLNKMTIGLRKLKKQEI